MKNILNNIADNTYQYLISNTNLKCLDDIIKYRSFYRPKTLSLLKEYFNKSKVRYNTEILYNTLDKVSLRYVESD